MTGNIKEILLNAYNKWADKDFAVEKKNGALVHTKYGEFLKKVNDVANALVQMGLRDKNIILICENCVDFCIADLAVTAFVGAIVNVSCQTKSQELFDVINVTQASAVVYSNSLFEEINKTKEKVKNVSFISLQSLIKNAGKTDTLFDFEDKDKNECVKIIFSSGTTSEPKGIMLSLENIFYGRKYLQMRTPFYSSDVMFLCLPLHHTYANICLLYYTLLSGLCLYFCSDKTKIAQELSETEPTLFCGVPMIYRKLYELYGDKISDAFGKNIRFIFSSGAKSDPEIRKIYKQSGLSMIEAYAQTETASAFSIEYPNDDDFESVGTIFEDLDVIIKNPNEKGEGDIAVKGKNVFLGYINNEKLTKESFDENGYFLTNDVGFIKDNKLYIVGRKGDVLIGENGENVYPREIEKKLKALSENIVKLQSEIVDNKLFYTVFVKENSDIDTEDIIGKYNSRSTKKDMIKFYKICYTNKDNIKS